MKIVGVIPARYASTRLPGKPLLDICGKPMIWHVYQQAAKCADLTDLFVATDSEIIRAACEEFNIPALMTSPDCFSGTDRVAEAAQKTDGEIYLNIQGDEPLIDPKTISEAISTVKKPSEYFGSLAVELKDRAEIESPHNVKIVFDANGYAIYASRSPIPSNVKGYTGTVYKHLGIYVYRKGFLLDFAKMKPTALELGESIEYLRVLENGYKLKIKITEHDSIGVDTQEDLEKVKAIVTARLCSSSCTPPPPETVNLHK